MLAHAVRSTVAVMMGISFIFLQGANAKLHRFVSRPLVEHRARYTIRCKLMFEAVVSGPFLGIVLSELEVVFH